MKVLNRTGNNSNNELKTGSKLSVIECMVTTIKAFGFASDILFLSIDLLNRFLEKVKENEHSFKD